MEEALRAALAEGAWLLGICVGYQLLFEAGEEHGRTDGLGLLPGVVERLPPGISLPHIGWNRLHDEGYPSVGCAPCSRAVEPGDDPRSGRWWWELPETRECGIHVGEQEGEGSGI